jgi:hypothetical protein
MNKSRSLLVRFAALSFATVISALLAASVHAQVTVDGTRDVNYGTALATQTVTSSWGGGNTLASLSVRQEGTKLYVFVAGRANGNSLVLFIDSKSGGANKLVSGLVSGGGEEWRIHNFSVGGNSTTDGLTFETGFNADFAINVQSAGWTSLFPLDPASPKSRSYMGNMINDASIAGGPVTKGKQSTGVDVSNVATHANGWEFEFDITALGVGNGEAEQVKFLALIIADGVNLSPNQVLGSLPNSTDLGGWGSFQATNFETISGTQSVTAVVNNADADGDGIPNSTDTDDDNDGLLDTVETNTGIFIDSDDTGSNPLVADTDGDGLNDGAEVAAGKNPNKKNYASMLIAGNFLTPSWSDTPTADNTMTAVSGDEFGWQINRLFAAPTAIQFKFLGGSWSTNWGASATPGIASLGSGNISLQTGSGVFRIYFNTDTLAYSFARATFGTYAEYAAAYGVTGGAADDDDADGLTNQQEYAANTSPLAGDTDGDNLTDASEIDGSAATGTLGVSLPTNPLLADTDGDGLRDDWELTYFLDPTDDGSVVAYTNYIPADIGLTISANPNGASADPDNDLLTNLQEFSAGSSPLAAGTGLVANNSKITIPGAFNGWDAEGTTSNTMALTGNFTWKLLFYFAAPPNGGSFKFANGTAFGSPANKNWGAQIPDNGVAVLNGGDIDGSAVFTAAGYYAVNFNDFTLAYSLAPLAATDADVDGLPDEYEAFYGGQLPTPTTDLVPATDYNGDGKTTAQNYADGTNPVKDVVAPVVSLAPGIDKVTWYAIGATIPDPIAADVVATDDITTSPAVTILSPLPDNSIDGFNTVIYQAEDGGGNITLFRRIVAVGNVAPAYYNLRYPAEMMVNNASSNNAYGEIFIDNATPGAGQATGVQAWVGVNSNNTDPSTWEASTWTAANYIGDEGNNDNYTGVVSGTGRTPGTYYYATRFQLGTNSSNPNYFYGGITSNGVGNPWGTVLSTNTNTGVITTNVYGNGVLTVQASRLVSFAVDMNVQTNKSLFDPATQGVEVRGSFGGWAGGSALTNSNNSGIFTGTFVVAGDNGATNQFKFVRTGPGTNAPVFEPLANDRTFTLAASDQTLASVFFNNDDGIGPVISLNGSSPVNLIVGDSYTDAGATATDAIDGSVTATPTGTVDTSVAGTYTITYSAVDAAGNAAIAITRTVIVAAAANPYDTWANQNGLAGAGALPTADPDNDGHTNNEEYAFGGNPNTANPSLLATTISGSNMIVSWFQRADAAAGAYKVKTTTNLSTTAFAVNDTLNAAVQAGPATPPPGYVSKQVSVAIVPGERNFLALAFEL